MDQEPQDTGQRKPKRLSREVIHENPWVNLYIDKVRFPEGRVIDRHYMLDFEKEAVAAVVENNENQILLVECYRYPTDTIEWEIPAGGIEKGEAITDCATREILEETGYTTENMKHIYTYYPFIGMSNKVFHIVRCRALGTSGEFDRNEIRSVRWFSREEIRQMINSRQLKDGFSLLGLLLTLGDVV